MAPTTTLDPHEDLLDDVENLSIRHGRRRRDRVVERTLDGILDESDVAVADAQVVANFVARRR